MIKKGNYLNTLEEFYIYSETKNYNEINDKLSVGFDKIFDVIVLHDNDRSRP
jgi:hypothetical protein